jgi:peptidyl-tRNA hydrolase, PTH2 family
MNTKQVIILRKDLKMRRGKEIAQGSHASMAFLTKHMKVLTDERDSYYVDKTLPYDNKEFAMEVGHWLKNSFRKIVCYVDSLEEMEEIYQKAIDAGLISHMIKDNGATEFGGVKTVTALGIGPHWDDKFIGITDHLKLA